MQWIMGANPGRVCHSGDLQQVNYTLIHPTPSLYHRSKQRYLEILSSQSLDSVTVPTQCPLHSVIVVVTLFGNSLSMSFCYIRDLQTYTLTWECNHCELLAGSPRCMWC